AEEALLEREPVAGGEQGPVGIAVYFEPLLLRRRFDEAVEIAARVDALAAPVGAREERHLDPGKIGGTLAMPGVVERMKLRRVERVDAVLRQFLVRERDRAGDQLAGDAAFARPLAQPVLDVGDLVLPPQLLKLA